jgi:bacillithiol system protein YtxJ
MGHSFSKIDNKEMLDKLITDSNAKPIVIFKHSNSCGISSAAYREMEKLEGQVNLLEVQSARDISRELADMTGIRHETPQVIVFKDGKAVWNASHFDVKAGAVLKALESHT